MDFEVIILGTDINAYYMARNCHEAYNKKAFLIGKVAMNFTSYSKILNLELVENLHDEEVFRDVLMRNALKFKGKKLLLIGSNDTYIRLIMENQDFLKPYYYFPIISENLLNNLLIKDRFYQAFKTIDIPDTYIYNLKKGKLDFKRINELKFPLILKPGNSINYYKYPFEGQAKVYKIKDKEELVLVLDKIKEAGYEENMIIQRFIPGDDSCLFDVMVYCDRTKKVKLMTLAQIGLQERTPTGVGNCTLLINGYNEYGNTLEVVEKLKKFIEKIDYHGFAEIDVKYDKSDQKFKVLEINPRQARCSYYLTACGFNLVEYLVDDLIYEKDFTYKFINEKMCLSFVPKAVIKKYVDNKLYKKEVLKLIKEGKFVDPLDYKRDRSIKRQFWLFMRKINYLKKYKNNDW